MPGNPSSSIRVIALYAQCCDVSCFEARTSNTPGDDLSIPKTKLVSSKYLMPLITQSPLNDLRSLAKGS